MKKLTFILSLTLTLSAFAQVPSYVPTNGLVGYWPFNGNANDESGNGNNGTVNGASLTSDRFGVVNSAYSFDGINDEVFANRIAQSSFSFSGWYNLNANQQYSPIIDAYNGNWELLIESLTPTFVKWISLPNVYEEYFTSQSSNINTWYHLVCSFSNNQVAIFLNGSLIQTFNNISLINTNGLYYFGKSYSGTIQYLNGKLDDIGIWNRALTPQEVAALYNGCSNSLIAQPTDQSIELSATTIAQFSTTSSATTASYQWQTNLGLGFQNLSDAGQYSESTTNTLSVNNITLANNNQQFRCIVADGSCEDTTDIAVLTVIDDLGIENLNSNSSKKLIKITDLNGKETTFRKNTVLLFIYEDGTVERAFEGE
jgi:hypothetical protein